MGKVVQLEAGRGLTAQQRVFVREFVRNGGNATAACEVAYPASMNAHKLAWQVIRVPHVQAEIRREQLVLIHSEGVSVATTALLEIARDKGAAPKDRIAASDKLYQAAGIIGKKSNEKADDNTKSLNEMTKEEIAALLAAAMSPEGPPEIEGAARDITPDDAPGSTGPDDASA